jgi:tetraacyldisaccharide 4'-kinase
MRRPWLLLFVPLYGIAVWIRNRLFDKGILKSVTFNIPTLVIGNLSAGGSGKTPHAEIVLRLLAEKKSALISRGYGRRTKGFMLLAENDEAEYVGDEPLQIKRKFPSVPVAVCEERIVAVPELLYCHPETELIVLDDAFQHRYLKGKFTILLSAYNDLFYNDQLLPAGNMRESKREAKRADCIIISKCPEELVDVEKNKITMAIRAFTTAPVFFSSILPESIQPATLAAKEKLRNEINLKESPLFLLSAIANGTSWAKNYLTNFGTLKGELSFSDHHRFSKRDIDLFMKKWNSLNQPMVLTTEKDWIRLMKYTEQLNAVPIFYYPIKVKMSQTDTLNFKALLHEKLFEKESIEDNPANTQPDE